MKYLLRMHVGFFVEYYNITESFLLYKCMKYLKYRNMKNSRVYRVDSLNNKSLNYLSRGRVLSSANGISNLRKIRE